MLVGFSAGRDCDGGLLLEEERTTPPGPDPTARAPPNFDDDGLLYGEVWFQPADLPDLIAALTEQLRLTTRTHGKRR